MADDPVRALLQMNTDQTEEDDSALVLSDEEVESDSEGQHRNLLDAITSLDKKSRIKGKVIQRSEPSLQVSPFDISSGDNGGSRVHLNDLVGSLRNTNQFSKVKTQIRKMQGRQKVMEAPLVKPQAQRIERSLAYKAAKKEVSRWTPIVRQNRQAAQLVFPLHQEPVSLPTTDSMVKTFKPSTDLEREIFEVLHGSKFAERRDHELTEAEEEALRAMSLDEAFSRRKELQKMRALQSYYAAKCAREKKIKSKKYHRIKKRSRVQAEKLAIEELHKTNPELAQEEIRKAEKLHAEERASLRHRNTGKWARSKMVMAKFDDEARQAVQEQLDKSRELTNQIRALQQDSSSDEDQGEEEEEENGKDGEAVTMETVVDDDKNPWMKSALKINSKSNQKDDPPVQEEEQPKTDDNDDEKPEEETTEENGTTEQQSLKDNKESKEQKEVITAENVAKKKRRRRSKKKKEGENGAEEEKGDWSEVLKEEKKTGKKRKRRGKKTEVDAKKSRPDGDVMERGTDEAGEVQDFDDDETMLEEGLERRKTLEEVESAAKRPDTKTNSPQRPKADSPTNPSLQKQREIVKEVHINPDKFFTIQPSKLRSSVPTYLDVDDNIDMIDFDQQRENIEEAFANDDVVSEFVEEKRKAEEAGKPKDIDLFMPGWGNWGGVGVKVDPKKRTRFRKKAPPPKPRLDWGLHHVIINEDKDEKLKTHQVRQLPKGFGSVTEFERSIRAPLGKDWNTPSAVAKLTEPKVVTRAGTIIQPISGEETFKKGKAKKMDMEGMDEGGKTDRRNRGRRDNKK
ncbi:PREDICTED: U3 small nucleolar RNA-associated protein 14 homolog A-like [Branchiostoma belcheri]|uniref:U3 small nucleolar RNA-associated protein 14 homolog A-like n=1 Tax=Branchiostoma belcheri TaxID=7741 RepID=A0A6P4Y4B2_BRABE|nr:PREDICTED: U3 small nucleolar RNA-associated protein 14 homolog A-like [Branchiostoma belcheri]